MPFAKLNKRQQQLIKTRHETLFDKITFINNKSSIHYSPEETFNKKFIDSLKKDQIFLKQCIKYILLPHINNIELQYNIPTKTNIKEYIDKNKKDFQSLNIEPKELLAVIKHKKENLVQDEDVLINYIFENTPIKSIKAGFMLRETLRQREMLFKQKEK